MYEIVFFTRKKNMSDVKYLFYYCLVNLLYFLMRKEQKNLWRLLRRKFIMSVVYHLFRSSCSQLHDEAQGHADFLARNNRFEASSGNNFGENLATSYNKDKLEAIRDVVKRWYDKIDFYNFRDPESNKDRPKSGQ